MSKRADKTPPTKGVNQVNVAATRPGLIVVDTALNLVASNTEAIQILTFPEPLEKIRHLDSWLTNKIRAHLVERQMQRPTAFVGEFRSAKRTYLCRSFPLDMNANGNGDQSGAEHQGEDRHADDRHSEDNGSGVPTALLVPAGRRSDVWGRKLAYTYGFVVFALASAAAGLARFIHDVPDPSASGAKRASS